MFTALYSNILAQKPAGEGAVYGRIVEEIGGKSVEYASVRLMRQKDSTTLQGMYSDADGKFNFENLPFGKFMIKITLTGQETKWINDIELTTTTKIYNCGTVRLAKDKTLNLEEVVVKGQIEMLKSGIDKKVYNVEEDLSVKGGTANDILNRLPSVEVDQDGRVMLRGEGSVTILIDGRPSSLSGGNGKTLLDALPAGSIERIEIVTNPSAKYDPDGTSGIINIVLKKNKLRGFNGLLTSNFGTGYLKGGNQTESAASLSFRNSWVNVYGSYNFRYQEGYRNNLSYIKQTFSADSSLTVDQTRTGTDLNVGHTFRTGADFYLKAKNTLGISMTGNVGQRDRTGDQWNSFYDNDFIRTNLWERTSYDPSQQKNFDVSLNYRKELKNDRGYFSVDANQSFGNQATQGFYQNNYFTPDSLPTSILPLKQQLFNTEKNNITTIQSDFLYIFPKIMGRFETGVKSILRNQQVDTYSEAYDYNMGKFESDTLANFQYQYDERIFSFYSTFGQQIKKFKYQGGIRLEQAYQIPELLSDSIRIVNDYFNWFPSFHLRYEVAPKTELAFGYSKRINRASSSDLNPFTSYADPFNLQRGNPYLKPEYINSFDLSFFKETKKLNISASAYYRYSTGVIMRVKEFYADNTSAVTYQNISETHSLGQEVVLSFRPTPWMRGTASWNGNYIWYITNMSSLPNRQGFNQNLKMNLTFEFWKKTASLQISSTFNGRRVTVQGIAQRQGPTDIGFEKKFKEGKWSVGARVTDIFNIQGFRMEVDRPSIYQSSNFKWLTRRYFISVSYKFGKLEMSNKKSGSGGGGGEGDM
ncbi:MAG: hypothetical protein RL264_2507 [Bacteroidota bacterium]